MSFPQERYLPIPEDLKDSKNAGQRLSSSKCSSHLTDGECPRPVTCAEYHYGQFGHKVLFEFCDECYLEELKRRKDDSVYAMFWGGEDRGFEIYEGSRFAK